MSLSLEFWKLFSQGAEAKLYRGQFLGKPSILKERFNKNYRHPQLDTTINKERVKAEGRALVRCKAAGVRSPAVYFVDTIRSIIIMEEIRGETAKETIARLQTSYGKQPELEELMRSIGESIAKLHIAHIIHGDLTTSNMIIPTETRNLVMIDFGLSHSSQSTEDKAVDLYVLERALISTHPNSDSLFKIILDSYGKTYKEGSQQVLSKFEEVRARGRKRTMVG